MATFTQLPATLDLALVAGDEFTLTATFDTNLTGHSVTAAVFNQATNDVLATPTISVSSGTEESDVTITLSEVQTLAVFDDSSPVRGTPTANIRWYLRWVTPSGYTRTVLSGIARVTRP